MTVHESALAWLHKQSQSKDIALYRAMQKLNRSEKEIKDIEEAIEIIDYLIRIIGNAKPKTNKIFFSGGYTMKATTIINLQITAIEEMDDTKEKSILKAVEEFAAQLAKETETVLRLDDVTVSSTKAFTHEEESRDDSSR